MLTFILRRLIATLAVLLVASFVVYVLTANSGDPLEELRLNTDPGAAVRLQSMIERLQLDVPVVPRYFLWLGGAAGCLLPFVFECNLGISVARGDGQVVDLLATAMGSTLQLITLASVIAIVFGLAVGMTTALRQYSGYDYTVTFVSFVFYSLPIFWVAVLLKEFGAIRFNQFLERPDLSWWVVGLIGIGMGVLLMSVFGGEPRTRLISFGVGAVGTVGLLSFLLFTDWFRTPALGFVGVTLCTAALAGVVLAVSVGFQQRRALLAAGLMVAVVAALWYPLNFAFYYLASFWVVVGVTLLLIGLGLLIGYLLGGDDRRQVMRTTAIIGGLSILPLVTDQMFIRWEEFKDKIPLTNGVIATVGSRTPRLEGDYWLHLLDSATHLILPTIALTIISFAGYTRYSRSSLLEVMNQDYVRTARAKGLSERVVVTRHAFRNAMIPIATVIAFDIGALIGGAIITEEIFAWQGMGFLFNQGLQHVDVNLVMGFFLVTGIATVVFNIVADVLYSALDPRIRVR